MRSMALSSYDVVVIGGGPGGYVAAAYAGRRGLSVACIEMDRVGGVCLHRGCIPSKALTRTAEVLNLARSGPAYGISLAEQPTVDLPSAMRRKEQAVSRLQKGTEALLRAAGVELISGVGRLGSDGVVVIESPEGQKAVRARHIILATGSLPRSVPGVVVDGKQVLTSDHALSLQRIPGRVVILGAGAIGIEFAYILSSFGSEVTVLELMPRVLPLEDEDVSAEIQRLYRRLVTIECGVLVTGVTTTPSGIEVSARYQAGGTVSFDADVLLVAVGRRPLTDNLGLAENGIELDRGYVVCDDRMRTANRRVFAVGDMVGRLPLAHTASAEGRLAVDTILGLDTPPLDYTLIPRATYCVPEIGSVGLTESRAKEIGADVVTSRATFRSVGKAVASGEYEGFCKLVADRGSGRLLGVHIVGPHATELIAEAGLALARRVTARDIARTVHAHPTLSEVLMEAAQQIS